MKSIFNVLVIFFLSVTFILGQVAVPNDWYYGNPGEGFNGISMKKAYGEFLKDKKNKDCCSSSDRLRYRH